MEAIGFVIMILGGIVSLVGSIMLLVEAFKTSVLWGIGCLIVPFVSLVFLVMYWSRAGKPFLISLGGGVVMVIGMALSGNMAGA